MSARRSRASVCLVSDDWEIRVLPAEWVSVSAGVAVKDDIVMRDQ